MQTNLADLFSNLYFPVVVCKNTPTLDIAYMNINAALLFVPTYSVDESSYQFSGLKLEDLLPIIKDEAFYNKIFSLGHIDNYAYEINSFDGEKLNYLISSNTVKIEQEQDQELIVFYFIENNGQKSKDKHEVKLAEIVNAAFTAFDTDSSIKKVLALAGSHINVSRAYIFEETSPVATKNTYEWCATGIEPMIDKLSYLSKKDYNYDIIVNAGMYITKDINTIESEADRKILAMQGIRALAITTLYDSNKPIGYVGFDDCKRKRAWSHTEIQFLKSVSAILSLLIKRRNAEEESARTLDVLQIVSDNIDSIIYVTSLDDYTVKFTGAALLRALNKTKEEVIGHKCWEVLQLGKDRPCEFCKIPELKKRLEAGDLEGTTWEHTNELAGRTYLLHDKIIKWTDGSYVHLETGIDISSRIGYEEELKRIASMDAMTQVYNREWGSKIISDILKDSNRSGCLCFIDIDDLKHTNDTYGHDSGDAMIKATINIIKEFLEPEDFVCRWGGDEFLVWFDKDEKETVKTVKQIQKAMDKYNNLNNLSYQLSFSYGITPIDKNAKENISFDALVTKADELMYKDKMEKRGLLRKRRRTD